VHLELHQFCEVIDSLASNAHKAVAVLWFHDYKQPDVVMSARELARVLDDHHIGTPDPHFLVGAIDKTRLCNQSSDGFSLKPGSRKVVREWLPADLGGVQPAVDHSAGYLPEAIWIRTRGYIEEVCRQLNGCFKSAYYIASAVLLRRLLETLIIEAYEYLNRASEIHDSNGNFFMLKELVERACAEKGHAGLGLGRDSKATLKELREVGNWSSHARRYIANAADLTTCLTHRQQGVRLLVQELIQIAQLQKPAT
jgi:hypothetical protein